MADFITWYKDEPTWRRFKEICIDKEQFGDSYANWEETVQNKIDEAKALGINLIKFNSDAEEFLDWCNANTRIPDVKARCEFTVLFAS